MANDGMPTKILAGFLDLSVARVGQLAKEGVITKQANGKYANSAITQYIKYIRDSKKRYDDDGEQLSKEHLIAKTKLIKNQNIKLQRELALRAGELITADRLEEVLRSVVRRYGTFKDWLRKHRPGDTEAMDAFCACPKAALKECQQRGWLEGEGIDDIQKETSEK